VVGEIAASKFVTMLYLTIDPDGGEIACASAGHPPPLIVSAGGDVTAIPARGLALGIDENQTYDEVRAALDPGAAVVVYTDGVVEARRDGELYGLERLESVLGANAGLPAERLAQAVVADARTFSGGELGDDCAVVVIRRSG
jgi:phosphoserine phosphatase RsbU/P